MSFIEQGLFEVIWVRDVGLDDKNGVSIKPDRSFFGSLGVLNDLIVGGGIYLGRQRFFQLSR